MQLFEGKRISKSISAIGCSSRLYGKLDLRVVLMYELREYTIVLSVDDSMVKHGLQFAEVSQWRICR